MLMSIRAQIAMKRRAAQRFLVRHKDQAGPSPILRALRTSAAIGVIAMASTAATSAVKADIYRESDSTALLVMSGTLDSATGSDGRWLVTILNPFTIWPAKLDNNLVSPVGGNSIRVGATYVFPWILDAGSAYDQFNLPFIYLAGYWGSQIPLGEPFSGSASLTLPDGSTFAAVGSTGQLIGSSHPTNYIGTWEVMAPVPEASSLSLIAVGIGLVLANLPGRRKNRIGRHVDGGSEHRDSAAFDQRLSRQWVAA